jgi:hypothetical protein
VSSGRRRVMVAAFVVLSTVVIGSAPVAAADAALPYPEHGSHPIKAIQPDGWADKAEIAGNNTGGLAMNLVWAWWQLTRKLAPCAAGEEAYDGYCFQVSAAIDADIADWTARGLVVTGVAYGVPARARAGKPCSPVAAGSRSYARRPTRPTTVASSACSPAPTTASGVTAGSPTSW